MIDQQARDLAVQNHTTTFLVEAAAGTGKTTLTVQRILALVEAGVKIERIAAVTFTVKAAGELKERLRKELSANRSSERASEALDHLDHMAVNTIHGFCSDLLRALPVEARLEPGFQVTDELEQSALRREFWNAWLRDALNQETPAELDLFLEFGGLSPRNLEFGEKGLSLYAIFETLLAASSSDGIHHPGDPHEELQSKLSNLDRLADYAGAAALSCSDQSDKLLPHLIRISQFSQEIPQDLLSLEAIEWLRANGDMKAGNVGKKGAWTGEVDVAAAKQIVVDVRTAIAALLGAIFTVALDKVARWLLPAVNLFRERQQSRGLIGFDDLLRTTRDMLRVSHTARRIFKTQYDYLHIDEFQDTDPVQTEIIFYLAEVDDEHALNWSDVTLKPGKLFLVGDPKQSIYRFRGADLRIYNEAMRAIEKQGKVLRIQTNFRSDAKILREVNGVFEHEMTGQSDDAPHYVALSAGKENPSSEFAVEILASRSDMDRRNADSAADSEANAIASHLKSMLSRGIVVQKKGAPELLSYKSIAILLRSGTHLENLTDGLRAADIPYVNFISDAFVSRTEIESTLTLLSALANPQDSVSVIGALRSPWFSIPDDELLLHRYHVGTFAYTAPREEQSTVNAALNTLRKWRAMLRDSSPSALLEHLLQQSQAPAIYGMKSQGTSRYQNLSRLVEMMRRLEQSGETSPLRIIERVRGMTRLADAVDAETHSPADAVRILTIHKAKGLEFPFVYLYQIAQSRKQPVLISGQTTNHISLEARSGDVQTNGFAQAIEAERERHKHEELRCLYVAMTRACQRLIIPIGWSETYSSLAARYKGDDRHLLPEDVERTVAEIQEQVAFSPDAPQRLFTGGSEQDAERARERFADWQTRRSEAIGERGQFSTVTSASEQEEAAPGKSSVRCAAMRVGTLVHSALEVLSSDGQLDRALLIAASREMAADEERSAAQEILKGGLHHELEALLNDARAIYRELPFTQYEGGEIREGKIDLLVHSSEGQWVIVDYKTDDVADDAVAMRGQNYEAQMRVYARAVEGLIGARPHELWLYFLRPRRIHKITQ